MTTELTRRSLMALGIAALSLTGLPAMADDYPSKPVTLVVAYAAGGGTDAIARVFAAQLEKELGGRVIVDNRPGAAGNIGTEDLVYMLERAGFETGYDIGALIETAKWMSGLLDKPIAASVSRAGVFPPA